MKNIPEKIYLQIDADGETPDDFNTLHGVSWCVDRIHENDIEFVRAKNHADPFIDISFPGDRHTGSMRCTWVGESAVPIIRRIVHDIQAGEPNDHVPRETLPENDLQTLCDAWCAWSDKTFGGSPIIAGRKLQHECQELLDAIELEHRDGVRKELADVFMIVMDVATKHGITVAELIQLGTEKFNINQTRKWIQQPDGTFQHEDTVNNVVEYVVKESPHISIDLCKRLKEHGIEQCSSHCFVSSVELELENEVVQKHTLESIGYDGVTVICDAFTRGDICMMLHTDANDDETTVHEICHNAIWNIELLHAMNNALRAKYEPHSLMKLKKP